MGFQDNFTCILPSPSRSGHVLMEDLCVCAEFVCPGHSSPPFIVSEHEQQAELIRQSLAFVQSHFGQISYPKCMHRVRLVGQCRAILRTNTVSSLVHNLRGRDVRNNVFPHLWLSMSQSNRPVWGRSDNHMCRSRGSTSGATPNLDSRAMPCACGTQVGKRGTC